MELENELKELKRIRSQLLEEIDVLQKEAEEDRKSIKLGAPLPPGMLLVSDLPPPEDTEHFNALDIVEQAANAQAMAASKVAYAAATAARAASVAQEFAQAAAHAHVATGPEAPHAQSAAFALAVQTVKLTTAVASEVATAIDATKVAASFRDALVTGRARAQSATAATG